MRIPVKVKDALQIPEKVKDAYYMAGAEYTNMDIGKRALFGITIGAIVFDLGPWNESMTGIGSAYVQESLGSPENSLEFARNSLITAAAGGTIMTAEQLAVGTLTALSIRNCQGTARIYNEGMVSEEKKSSLKGNVVDTAFWGTSVMVTAKHVKESERSLGDDLKFVAKGAPLVGAYMFAIVGAGSIIINGVDSAGHEEAANTLESVAMNPFSYVGAYALYKAVKKTRGYIKKNKFKSDVNTVSA
jgi:hypothetical protein